MNSKNLLAVILAITTFHTGLAQEPAAAAPKPKWETTAAAGLTLTSGNSETFLATVTLDTKRKWEQDEFGAGLAFGYGESEVEVDDGLGGTITQDEKTTQFGNAYAQYNHLFNDRLYAGVRVDAGYDTIAGVEYRVKISPLVGYYFIKNEKTSLAGEIGPTYVLESLEGEDSNDYLALRIAERFEHKFSKSTKLWQSAEYLPDIENWTDKYLIIAELGVDAAITTKLSLRVVLQDTYDSEPAAGREHNDIRLIAGLAYKF
jgi:putative salt-induced outer membrane protein YdiY